MTGFQTLLYKEILRFWKVAFQTIAAPVLTAMLYIMIFLTSWRVATRHFPASPMNNS